MAFSYFVRVGALRIFRVGAYFVSRVGFFYPVGALDNSIGVRSNSFVVFLFFPVRAFHDFALMAFPQFVSCRHIPHVLCPRILDFFHVGFKCPCFARCFE
jgi:hypothetical protein